MGVSLAVVHLVGNKFALQLRVSMKASGNAQMPRFVQSVYS